MGSEVYKANFADLARYGTKTQLFSTAVTGTDTDAILTPTTGKKFVLKGFQIHAIVTTVLAGTGTALFLCDMASGDSSFAIGDAMWPIAGFAADAAAGSVVRNDVEPVFIPVKDYRSGVRALGKISAAANNQIKISPNASLSTGVIQVSGVLYYDEV